MKFNHKGVGEFEGEVKEIVKPATFIIELTYPKRWEKPNESKNEKRIVCEPVGQMVKVPFTELHNYREILTQMNQTIIDQPQF